jgi:hypothetical protein
MEEYKKFSKFHIMFDINYTAERGDDGFNENIISSYDGEVPNYSSMMNLYSLIYSMESFNDFLIENFDTASIDIYECLFSSNKGKVEWDDRSDKSLTKTFRKFVGLDNTRPNENNNYIILDGKNWEFKDEPPYSGSFDYIAVQVPQTNDFIIFPFNYYVMLYHLNKISFHIKYDFGNGDTDSFTISSDSVDGVVNILYYLPQAFEIELRRYYNDDTVTINISIEAFSDNRESHTWVIIDSKNIGTLNLYDEVYKILK